MEDDYCYENFFLMADTTIDSAHTTKERAAFVPMNRK